MSNWTIKELEKWSKKIEKVGKDFGLDFFPIEYEIYSHRDMLNAMAYTGIPIHYNHWSFGKQFEIQQTYYYYGLTHLPYEMVINSNPSIAYLMKDNSLLSQILVMSHVCGHVDFFKNNTHFKHTRPELVLDMFKQHARRIRTYREDPSIGDDKVEEWLDAAHSVAMNVGDYQQSKIRDQEEVKAKVKEKYFNDLEEWKLFGGKKPEEPDWDSKPLTPEPNILLFIRDNRKDIKDWQKDILTIVDREARYFMPQLETKISNEGWASYWHYNIVKELNLPQEFHIEFMIMHNKVIVPAVGRINPYYLGFRIWNDIEEKHGREEMFIARESFSDIGFLSQYLTKELIYKLDLFQYGEKENKDIVVEEVADKEGWKKVKATLISRIGRHSIPKPMIVDSNLYKGNALLLEFDDPYKRDLDDENKIKTLSYIEFLWGRAVYWREGGKITRPTG